MSIDEKMKEMERRYGTTEMYFKSYYKYTFVLRGEASDGAIVIARYGGNADDIYRFDLSEGESIQLGEIDYYSSVDITDKEGNKIYEWFDAL